MRIKTIAATGLKGPGFRHNLSALTFITGDNGAGKTGITDAVKIALLSRHPILGATPKGIFRLSSGDLLEIDMSLISEADESTKWRKQWTKKGQRISTQHSILTAEQEELLDGVIPAVLDFDAFAKAKPTERQRILEDVMAEGKDQSEQINDKLANIKKRTTTALLTSATPWDGQTFQSFESHCSQAKKDMGQDVKRLKGALQQGIVDEATQMMAADTNAINPEDLARCEELLESTNRQIGSQTEVLNGIATAQMNAPEKPHADRPDPAYVQALETEIRDNLALIEQAQKKALHNSPLNVKIQQIDISLQGKPEEAPEGGKLEKEDPAPTVMRQANAKAQQAGFSENVATKEREVRALKTERNRLLEAGACPTCGTAGEKLDDAIKVLFGTRIEDAGMKLVELRDLYNQAIEEHTTATEERKLIEKNNQKAEEWSLWLRAQLMRSERSRLVAQLKPIFETKPHDAMRLELSKLRIAETEWADYEKEVGQVPTKKEGMIAANKLDIAKSEGVDLRERLNDLKKRNASHQDARALIRNQTRHQEELDASSIAEKELAALAGWAKEQSLLATSEAMAPILKPANRILNGVIDGSLAISGTEIGIQPDLRGNKFRPLEVLSGAEAATTAIAVQVALAAKSTVPVIIADELSRLRFYRRCALIHNLRDAIERGEIEQAIVIDHDPAILVTAMKGDQVIECGKVGE